MKTGSVPHAPDGPGSENASRVLPQSLVRQLSERSESPGRGRQARPEQSGRLRLRFRWRHCRAPRGKDDLVPACATCRSRLEP